MRLLQEIPPRARGRVTQKIHHTRGFGNTPACAGKSYVTSLPWRSLRKYPRVRGEETSLRGCAIIFMEIPPRARGREVIIPQHLQCVGNTPACAGKSNTIANEANKIRKYPRVRGEELPFSLWYWSRAEIPPRARGRDTIKLGDLEDLGNTPACAGKSGFGQMPEKCCRKYPRVRGEEDIAPLMMPFTMEIPPRARGRASYTAPAQTTTGNTPACAGKSQVLHHVPQARRKYPRVRGEEEELIKTIGEDLEIPPRARGRDGGERVGASAPGNTPACAGKSHSENPSHQRLWKYPRVRGEELCHLTALALSPEIPPRARGRDFTPRVCNYFHGNTPACAGKRGNNSPAPSVCRKYPRVRGEE